jgi:HK97 family phage prohead protease
MPWHVEKRDGEYCVIKDADDSNEGCHPTEAEAKRHIAALYANEPKAEAIDGITFDDPEAALSFRVNPERRTISGLAVPWGKVAKSGFAKWRFHPGSLRWSDVSRIKLNMSHDHKEAVGVATRLQNSAAGLDVTFKVARGTEGDRALSLAEDRVLDGFSIEVDFEDEDGWMPDPEDEDVRLVKSGRLGGVALTAFPAFDDARVDRVAAMKAAAKMEEVMAEDKTDDHQDLEADEPEARFEGMLQGLANKIVDSQQKLNAEMAQSVGESISEGVKTALENIGDPQRGPVRAARYTVTREEPVYRFDGTGHSLVRDAWYAATAKDDDAIDRLRKYKRQTEEVATLVNQNMLSFAPQTTSTASQVIPPGYRPELYVPMLQQERPFVSAASNGTIANATPFTVPTFTSVTTGSADHVEGTNPSDGSLAFGTKTVTPQAVSGRLVLSREVIDASNPAIDQIALAAMREAYNRQTEVKVYTLLNGANGSGGTITSGFVPSGAQAVTVARGTDNQGLVVQIRSSLASYTFARFAQPTIALMGPTATGYLAAALDTTKRPLFPYIGPYNSVGTGNAVGQGWQVDGLNFIPAWGATGVAAGDTQIFILNRADLWVWESPLLQFRFEEKQGPANIELNIFGYFATHLLRPVGLSGIRIT